MSCNQEKHVCYCHNCGREFRSLGIASHRKAHLRRGEKVVITYSGGETRAHWPTVNTTERKIAVGDNDGDDDED